MAFPEGYSSDTVVKFSNNDIVKELQIQLLKNWTDQQFVSVSLLGIKFSIADANVVGGITLTVISIWFFYCVRRENHLMAKILSIADKETIQIKAHVLYGIHAAQIFTTFGTNDDPIRTVRNQREGGEFHALRLSTPILFFFPSIAIFVNFISDILSLFWIKAIFRGDNITLFEYLIKSKKLEERLPVIGLELLLEVALMVIVSFLLWRAYDFHLASEQLLQDANKEGFGVTEAGYTT